MEQSTYYVAAISATVVGFTLTLLSIYMVRRQLVVIRRNREVDLLVKLYQISTAPGLQGYLDSVWGVTPTSDLSSEERKACDQVCLFFEMVGSLVSEGYCDTALIESYFGSLVTGSFDLLRPYIDAERTTPYNSNYAVNFESLARMLRGSPKVSRTPGVHPMHVQGGSPSKPKPL